MTKTEFPTWKKENNKKSSSAIEALSDEDRVLDYGGLGNFSLSGFEMVSVATNEDEDDWPIYEDEDSLGKIRDTNC